MRLFQNLSDVIIIILMIGKYSNMDKIQGQYEVAVVGEINCFYCTDEKDNRLKN